MLIIDRVIEIIKKNEIDVVWIEGVKQTFKLGYLISKKCNTPIHLSINDDITGNTSLFESKLFIKKYFKYLLFKAKSIDFISEEMRVYYEELYGYNKRNYIILWLGEPFKLLHKPSLNQNIKKIIFYGNSHGFETIEAFCKALDISHKDGKTYELDIYSATNFEFLQQKYYSAEYKGSPKELVDIVSNYDLVYVPMSFRKSKYAITRTSISAKMILALQAQIPILAHGPIYASNTMFAYNNHVGFRIISLDSNEILKELNNISLSQREIASKNARKIYEQGFNTDIHIERFKRFLNS